MRLWVFKRQFSTILQLYRGGNDIKDIHVISHNTDRIFRKKEKNEYNKKNHTRTKQILQ